MPHLWWESLEVQINIIIYSALENTKLLHQVLMAFKTSSIMINGSIFNVCWLDRNLINLWNKLIPCENHRYIRSRLFQDELGRHNNPSATHLAHLSSFIVIHQSIPNHWEKIHLKGSCATKVISGQYLIFMVTKCQRVSISPSTVQTSVCLSPALSNEP